MKSHRRSSGSTPTQAASQSSTATADSNAFLASSLPGPRVPATPMLAAAALSGRDIPRRDDTVANPGVASKHANELTFEKHEGQAFIKGEGDELAVEDNDVAQGSLGNCYWMAGMAAVAKAEPQVIENLIKENGDGTYDVTLWDDNLEAVTVTVDGKLPTRSSGSLAYAKAKDQSGSKKELWPALLEKAWAIMHKKSGKEGYDALNEGGMPGDAMERLTGYRSSGHDPRYMAEADVLSIIENALENNFPISVATLTDGQMNGDKDLKALMDDHGLYACHCYTFFSVDGKDLKLRNPWGSDHPKAISVANFQKIFDVLDVNDGT